MHQPRYLGPAEVRWNDYVGTAAADDLDALAGRPSIYDIAQLDRERWTILGVDLSIWHDNPTVTIFALDRVAHHIETNGDIDAMADRLGELPVHTVILTSPQMEQFLNDAFNRVAVRLIARGVRERRFRVEGPLTDPTTS